MNKKGSLVNVGLGMTLGSHITPLSRSYIENADIVFVAASNNLVEQWVETMNDNVVSLQQFYNEGTSRMITYRKMVEVMMTEVRAGKNVCGAFYGHPGVFAWPPHKSIEIARKDGYHAHMEPGISAEACLYADLGFDPGEFGCFQYEASYFMFRNKVVDPTSYLILWQVGVAGDRTLAKFSVETNSKQILVDKLLKTYPKDHIVIIYECAILPTDDVRIEEIKICDIAQANISIKSTVVIPPSKKAIADNDSIIQLENL
jgi:precorrin-3B methylase